MLDLNQALDMRGSAATAQACVGPMTTNRDMQGEARPSTKAEELRAFLLLAIVMAPVLAVAVVSGYGFLVWMYQLVAGPPGAPI